MLRVLVVEDDALVGLLLAETLGEMGYEVCGIAATEAEAVSAAAIQKPDLMIVDARLGAGSGLTAMDEILLTGYIPHLFVSGNIAKVRAQKPDAMMLQKPYRDTELARAMESALGAMRPSGGQSNS
jgi:CheY-like chemotaxis protein